MTVKELRKCLQNFDDNLNIVLSISDWFDVEEGYIDIESSYSSDIVLELDPEATNGLIIKQSF